MTESNEIIITMRNDDKDNFYAKIPYGKIANVHRIGGLWQQSTKEWKFPIDDEIWLKFQDEFKVEFRQGLVKKSLAFILAMDERRSRLKKFTEFKRTAMKDEPTDFGVDGVSLDGKNCLFNYQRWGIQCGLQVGDGFLIGDQPGLGKCLCINNLCNFGFGIDRVSEVIGQQDESGWYPSQDGVGEWHEVSNVSILGNANGTEKYFPVKRVYREKVAKTANVKLQNGLVNQFGWNHRFFTNHGWKSVGELNETDWILVNDRVRPANPMHFDLNDVYWLAWQIGEGCDCGNNMHNITNTDLTVLERLQKCILARRSQIVEDTHYSNRYYPAIHENIRNIEGHKEQHVLNYNHRYTEYLNKVFGYKMHTKSGEKEIPMSILNADDECVRVFVRALWDAEGCCNADNLELTSKSYDIVEKMWYLLKRFGIFSVVSKKNIKNHGVYWRLNIGGVYARMFKDEINFDTQYKRDALDRLCSKTANTNVGYSSPCRHLIRHLIEDVLETSYNIAGIDTSKMNRIQEYGVQKIREFVEKMETLVENGIYRKKSKWSHLEDNFNRNRVERRSEIDAILNEIKTYYTGAFQWLKVMSVECVEAEDYVYDFEVDDESHNYYASGMLTHNTIQAIGLAIAHKNRGEIRNCLIICPASLKYNWLDEIHKFTKETALVIGHKAKNAADREKQWVAQGYFFKIVNYELVARDLYHDQKKNGADTRISAWKGVLSSFDMVVMDEIQYCKHHTSQRTMSCRQFTTKYRVGLSGTPIDGRLEEIHSIFQILKPGLFVNRQRFMERYAEYDYFGAVKGYHFIGEVADKIEPYYLRRQKEEVLKDLPPKIFKDMHVQLSPKNMKAYQDIVKKRSEITSEASAIELLIRARQFLDFPEILGMHNTSDKYAVFKELLDNLVKENGQKVIVFSEYTNTIHWLVKNLEPDYGNILVIDGSVSSEERQNIVKKFNGDPNCHLILMSDAGAEGLNLQTAHAVIHYTDSYKPTKMQQRNDRAHRATTQHSVTIYRFVVDDTIDERVRGILARKMAVNNALLNEHCEEFVLENSTAMDLIKCL